MMDNCLSLCVEIRSIHFLAGFTGMKRLNGSFYESIQGAVLKKGGYDFLSYPSKISCNLVDLLTMLASFFVLWYILFGGQDFNAFICHRLGWNTSL